MGINEPGGDSRHEESKVGKKDIISKEELITRAAAEGIDVSKIQVTTLHWAESAPLQPGVKSALVRSDLILRSDGSAVWLDKKMASDSIVLTMKHRDGKANPKNLSWEEWVQSVTQLWQGSEDQQNQIRDRVDFFSKGAVVALENVVGNHDKLKKEIFTTEEIEALMKARQILIDKEKK